MNVGPLQKILEHECRKGYLDSAVIGGLDKFLRKWIDQNIALLPDPILRRYFSELNLDNPNYTSANKLQRQQLIKQLFDFLHKFNTMIGETGEQSVSLTTPTKLVIPTKSPSKINQSIDVPISIVKGISSAIANKFIKLGVSTVRDLLYFFPHRHLDYSQRKTVSQLQEGEDETIIANVWEAREIRPGGRRSTEAIVGDETGNIRVVWFNNPYLIKNLAVGTKLVISGRVGLFRGRHVFESPEWELLEDKELIHTGRLVPLYPLTKGLHHRQVRKLMKAVIDQWLRLLKDFLPIEIRERLNLMVLPEAIRHAHFPQTEAVKTKARIRLAFDELFLLQLGVLNKKQSWQQNQLGNSFIIKSAVLDSFIKALPFTLTVAQQRVLKEIFSDFKKKQPMSRLLQGEVGSGKTVVATAALIVAAANRYQGAFMAPTEILAEQHFSTICQLLSRMGQQEGDGYLYRFSGILSHPLTVALLIGDISQVKKEELQKYILKGEIDFIIGTHALIQKGVEFCRLGLVVVDEQHRFGVAQRSLLRQKGSNPHMLVMTATPIPRTLALTLYGDLDLSVIDQLPPGRQMVKTKWLKPRQRESAYAFIRKQVSEGRQAFIICPLIEESETVQARAAIAEYQYLSKEVFPRLKLGLLHGRISSMEKDKVMRNFRSGELDILVSTPVVEVGIDVPNATVMMVESADRFGLSQLHQFRGRVGRGQGQSYCMLLAQNPSMVAKERLDIIENTQDGFQLAEEDLKLRGPGEFFGTRQSGIPDLKMAKISDIGLLEEARHEAIDLFQKDPNMRKIEHQLLAKEMTKVWNTGGGEWS